MRKGSVTGKTSVSVEMSTVGKGSVTSKTSVSVDPSTVRKGSVTGKTSVCVKPSKVGILVKLQYVWIHRWWEGERTGKPSVSVELSTMGREALLR